MVDPPTSSPGRCASPPGRTRRNPKSPSRESAVECLGQGCNFVMDVLVWSTIPLPRLPLPIRKEHLGKETNNIEYTSRTRHQQAAKHECTVAQAHARCNRNLGQPTLPTRAVNPGEHVRQGAHNHQNMRRVVHGTGSGERKPTHSPHPRYRDVAHTINGQTRNFRRDEAL